MTDEEREEEDQIEEERVQQQTRDRAFGLFFSVLVRSMTDRELKHATELLASMEDDVSQAMLNIVQAKTGL